MVKLEGNKDGLDHLREVVKNRIVVEVNNKLHYLYEEEWNKQQEFIKEREKLIGKFK